MMGWFSVSPDPTGTGYVLEWRPPTGKIHVAESMLLHTPPGLAIKSLKKALLQQFDQMLETHLAGNLIPIYEQKQGWMKPVPAPSSFAPGTTIDQAIFDELTKPFEMTPDQLSFLMGTKTGTTKSAKNKKVGEAVVDALGKAIPGFSTMRQPCPRPTEHTIHCDTFQDPDTLLQETIVHLNDHHRWSREQIADWLDTLDHDLRFKAPEGGEDSAEHSGA
jgi:hypothetical protein